MMMMVKAQSCGQYLSRNSFANLFYILVWNNDCQLQTLWPLSNNKLKLRWYGMHFFWIIIDEMLIAQIGVSLPWVSNQDILGSKLDLQTFFLLKSNFRLECWLVIAIAHCINAAEFAFCIAYTVRSYVELQKCNLLLLAFLLCTFRFRKLNIRKMSSYME